jgi:hypothetical protein
VRMVKLATSAQISQPDVRCRVFVNIFLLPPKKKGLSPRGVWLLLCVSIEDHTKQGLTNVDFGMTGVNMQFL